MWKRTFRSLKSGRGPWGTEEAVGRNFIRLQFDHLVHWKLDKTENFSRMRLKKKRNYNFDRHVGASDYGPDSAAQQLPVLPQITAPKKASSTTFVCDFFNGNQDLSATEADDWGDEKNQPTLSSETDTDKIL